MEKNQDYKFRKLTASDIDIRIGQKKEKVTMFLLYKNARVDMNILDETVGQSNWGRDHKELKGNLYCGVSIKTPDGWVTKWDCGTESNTEKEKGEASDSFKRACVNWGIGRELYSSPKIGIWNDKLEFNGNYLRTSLSVSRINYDESGNISDLAIINSDTLQTVWEMKNGVIKVGMGAKSSSEARPHTQAAPAPAVQPGNPMAPTAKPLCTMAHYKGGKCGQLVAALAKHNCNDIIDWAEGVKELKDRYDFEDGVLSQIAMEAEKISETSHA